MFKYAEVESRLNQVVKTINTTMSGQKLSNLIKITNNFLKASGNYCFTAKQTNTVSLLTLFGKQKLSCLWEY